MGMEQPKVLHYRVLTLLHSERPKLYTILAFLSAVGLRMVIAPLKANNSVIISFLILKKFLFVERKLVCRNNVPMLTEMKKKKFNLKNVSLCLCFARKY